MMNLAQFLDFLETNSEFSGIWYFYGTGDYPVLFFMRLMQSIEKKTGTRPSSLAVASDRESHQNAQMLLSMSFLGQSLVYAIVSASEQFLVECAAGYTGPHLVIGYAKQEKPSISTVVSGHLIELPEEVDSTLYKKMYAFTMEEVPDEVSTRSIFSRQKVFSLEEACLLAHYHAMLGRRIEPFVDNWLLRIVKPHASLFSLSQAFFSKNSIECLSLWKMFEADYPPEFWLAYWAEQLWQAMVFLQVAPTAGVQARKYASRLPFSFTNKDWRNYTLSELQNAYLFLVEHDYAVKNGLSMGAIDLFLVKFLANKFLC